MAFLDSWEEEVNDFVKKYYQSFFAKNNFVFFKKEAFLGGGSMIFSDSGVLFEIASNKNRFVIKFGQVEGKMFFGLDIIKAYFKITDYRIDEDDIPNRKKVLLESFHADDYSGNATFLIANFNKIKNLFSSENYNETKVQLEKLSLEKQKYV
ncbi:MAG: hypothetical protein HY840_15510 [Bacteroidetes bacterium]|nr:hypothetical protein [Bacteroidota bacterium]